MAVYVCRAVPLVMVQGPAWVAPALVTDVVHTIMAECSNMVRQWLLRGASVGLVCVCVRALHAGVHSCVHTL